MKKIIQLTLALTTIAFTYSCADEFLDNNGTSGDSQPTQLTTSSQLAFGANTNPEIPAAFVNGMYAQMIQVGSGGSGSQTDFGQKGQDIYADIVSGDMALTASNFRWYNRIAQLDVTENFIRGENRIIWRYYYRIIRSANTIIESLGGNDVTPTVDADKYSMGQAKAMRAHSYFYLTQYYQKEYNASEPILPMPIAPGSNLPKSTAGEIYDLMEKDLTEAITLLDGFNRTAKNQVNKEIAQTIYAYVLGARGTDYPKMASLTQAVINSTSQMIKPINDLTDGFNDVNDNSWMWGIDIVPENGLGLVSWWGQIDAFSYSYGWAGDFKAMDLDLYSQIASNDARKNQYLNNPGSGRHLQPLFKFYWASGVGIGSGPQVGITGDYVYMRIEEAYLLNAEANARPGGNVSVARNSLKAVMQNRIPDVTYIDALSGQALLDEIYLQTRIELWGEGKSYLAMKRNKATVNRASNHLFLANESIMYNEERMTFEIPQDEIQNNPFVSDQNQ